MVGMSTVFSIAVGLLLGIPNVSFGLTLRSNNAQLTLQKQGPDATRTVGTNRNVALTMVHPYTDAAEDNDNDNIYTSATISRRKAIAFASTFAPLVTNLGIMDVAVAEDEGLTASADFSIKGTVLLPVDSISSQQQEQEQDSITKNKNAALYVTCRPDRADNVPAAILSGTRGKPPPVLVARFDNPEFPFEFALTQKDLTVEGVSNKNGGTVSSMGCYWWKDDNLIVSARLDSDGLAATRSPDDLVGRGIYKNSNQGLSSSSSSSSASVSIPLKGRGVTGKFVTGKKK